MSQDPSQNPYDASAVAQPTRPPVEGLRSIKTAAIALLPVVGATAGYLAIRLPWKMAVAKGLTKTTNSVDGMQPISLYILALIGFGFGIVTPRWFWIGAVFELAAFPVIAFCEIHLDPTSHNLWPIEFIVYAFLTIPGLVAGLAGSGIHRATRYVVGPHLKSK